MKTITKKQAQITATSTPNFFDVLSSDNWTHYPLLMTGPGTCVCGCWAGQAGRPCYHRTQALEQFQYVPETQEEIDELSWARIKRNIERESERDAIRDLFGDNWTGPLDAA